MNNYKILKTALWFFLLIPMFLQAQQIRIVGVDASNYPIMKGELYITGSNGKALRNFDPSVDFTITDGSCDITNAETIVCEENISKFSLILLIDKSQSMQNFRIDPDDNSSLLRMDFAKQAARSWVDKLPGNRSECAIMAFSAGTYKNPQLVHDFSTDKQELKSSINQISALGGTDYNRAFFGTEGNIGLIEQAKKAKYKPIIIFLTDGEHKEVTYGPFKSGEVQDSLLSINATFYALTMGVIEGGSIEQLGAIAGSSGGEVFPDFKGEEQVQDIYDYILDNIDPDDYPAPCEIEWTSCCDGGDLHIRLNPPLGPADDYFEYTIPETVKPALIIQNANHEFLNIDPGTPGYSEIVLEFKAINNPVVLDGFSSNDGRFGIESGLGGTMQPGDVRDVRLRYTPNDSLCHQAAIMLETNACSGTIINPSAGYIYHSVADLGSTPLNVSLTKNFTGIFCNHSCNKIKITDYYIQGSDATYFHITDGIYRGMEIEAGQCVDFEYYFVPDETRSYEAEILIKTDKISVIGQLKAMGKGRANIESVASVEFDNLNCRDTLTSTKIALKNSGLGPLEINNIEITGSNPEYFYFDTLAYPVTIDPDTETELTLYFKGYMAGAKSASLKISNNSENAADFQIPLNGFIDDIKISSDLDTLDFGFNCPGKTITKSITITNDGSIAADLSIPSVGGFTPDNSDITIDWGSSGELSIYVNYPNAGSYTEILQITDTLCNSITEVVLNVDVYQPEFADRDYIFTTDLGTPKDQTIYLVNETPLDISISSLADLQPDNSQFTVLSFSANTIPAFDSISVEIRYNPDDPSPVTSYLIINAEPCSVSDGNSIRLIGNPGAALAEISTGEYSQVSGGTIDVEIELDDLSFIEYSGSASLSSVLSYDTDLLEPVGFSNTGMIDLAGLPIDVNEDNQIVATVVFNVLHSETKNECDLTFSSTSSDNGKISFVETGGKFTYLRSQAIIAAPEEIIASAGDYIEFELFLKNTVNVVPAIHKSISAELKFDATLLKPVGNTPTGYVDSEGMRIIQLSDISLSEWVENNPVESFSFRAMLGRKAETELIIHNATAENGFIKFDTSGGKFILTDICIEGDNPRFIDPWGNTTTIRVLPNPVNETSDLIIDLLEEGQTEIFVTDILGNRIKTLFKGHTDSKGMEFQLHSSEYSTGSYIIIMKTPGDIYSRVFNIIK